MARKLEQAQKGFLTALESDDAEVAKQHLTEVQKLADFLADDLTTIIAKSESAKGVNDIYAGGVPREEVEQVLLKVEDYPAQLLQVLKNPTLVVVQVHLAVIQIEVIV